MLNLALMEVHTNDGPSTTEFDNLPLTHWPISQPKYKNPRSPKLTKSYSKMGSNFEVPLSGTKPDRGLTL